MVAGFRLKAFSETVALDRTGVAKKVEGVKGRGELMIGLPVCEDVTGVSCGEPLTLDTSIGIGVQRRAGALVPRMRVLTSKLRSV
jgi:hypothetical protein